MSERSDQPTEEPTARRLQKALEDGQLAFSNELVGGLIILVAMLFFMGMGRWFFDSMLSAIRERLSFFDPMLSHPDSILLAVRRNLEQVGYACLGLMLSLALIVVAAGLMQTRFNISFKPLELKWNKLSIQTGLKRIFSTRSLNTLAISLAKTAAIVAVGWFLTMAEIQQVTYSGVTTFGQMIGIGAKLCLNIGFATAILLVAIGCVDLGFQLWKQQQDLMMTRQEIKEENKDSDGDPQMKARIRRLQTEMSKKRVSHEVPKATFVVTNPTHFAVALKYDPEVSAAPIVIAKGSDFLAKQIIRIARESGVPVVERKPVARFLYANVKTGGEIPMDLYQAVAEILNFIRTTNQSAA